MIEFEWITTPESKSLVLFAIAIMFTVIGIWAGLQLNRNKSDSPPTTRISPDELDIRPCEFEILELMATGMSNQEIADKLHISISTVKTHNQNLFVKLDVKRRTQAVTKAKEIGLLNN